MIIFKCILQLYQAKIIKAKNVIQCDIGPLEVNFVINHFGYIMSS